MDKSVVLENLSKLLGKESRIDDFCKTYDFEKKEFIKLFFQLEDGGDIEFAEDNGFALLPWSTIVFKNHGFYHHHDIATVMGQYDFFDIDQNITSVEYTFGYVRAKNKQLKIFLHHSSLPYNGGLEKSDKV